MRKVEITIGILLIIGLSLGIGFGFYREYDGKNLREFSGMYAEMRQELQAAQADATSVNALLHEARRQARADRSLLAYYQEVIVGLLEEP